VGLSFVRAHSWARVKVTWDPPGTFIHWYVDFQLQPRRFEGGYDTCDLVIDIMVLPDRSWSWKDRSAFEDGVGRGIFSSETRDQIFREAEAVIAEIESATGRFSDEWTSWRPAPDWPIPVLPENYVSGLERPEGSQWLA
jgi:predicted RNA-binding protein associated with RNAse of E/G family